MKDETVDDEVKYAHNRLASLQRLYTDSTVAENLNETRERLQKRLDELGLTSVEGIAEFEENAIGSLVVPPPGSGVPTRAWVLDQVLQHVAARVDRIGAKPLDGIVIGPLQERVPNAMAPEGLGTRMIVVNQHLMLLAYLIAKACAPLVAEDAPAHANHEDQSQLDDWHDKAIWDFATLLNAQLMGDVSEAHSTTPGNWPYWPLAFSWTHAIEIFVVAHEYCHLLHAQDDQAEVLPSDLVWDGKDPRDAERLADRFAARTVWVGASEDPIIWAHLAPLTYFWFLTLVSKFMPDETSDTHPPFEERLEALENNLPTQALLDCWQTCRRRLTASAQIAISKLKDLALAQDTTG